MFLLSAQYYLGSCVFLIFLFHDLCKILSWSLIGGNNKRIYRTFIYMAVSWESFVIWLDVRRFGFWEGRRTGLLGEKLSEQRRELLVTNPTIISLPSFGFRNRDLHVRKSSISVGRRQLLTAIFSSAWYSLLSPIREAAPPKGVPKFLQAYGVWKDRDYTSLSIRKGGKSVILVYKTENLKELTDAFYLFCKRRKGPGFVIYSHLKDVTFYSI